MVKRYYDTGMSYLFGQGAIFITIFILGIVSGSIYSVCVRDNSMLFFTINQYITLDYEASSKWEVMKDSFLVYGKNLIIIWAGGLFNVTLAISCIVFFIICFSYGFTTTCFVLIYGLKGICISILAFGVQAIIIIFIGMYLGNMGIRYSVYNKIDSVKEYIKVLTLTGVAVMIVVFIDAYIQPVMQQVIYLIL